MSEKIESTTKYDKNNIIPNLGSDEIEFYELIQILLKARKKIIIITIICSLISVAYAFYAPEVYKAETLLVPAQEENSNTSSMLNQFGGLASMAGVSIPSDSNIEEAMATLKSRKFLKVFIDSNKLVPKLFEEIWDSENQSWKLDKIVDEPTIQEAIKKFKSNLLVEQDKKTGLVTISISWKTPDDAANWVNNLVIKLNEQLREQAIIDSNKRVGYLEEELAKTTLKDMRAVLYNLLQSEKQKAMLANVNENFALKVIDPAMPPEVRDKPKMKLIIALGFLCGGLLGVSIVLLNQVLQKIKINSLQKKIHE